MRSIRKEMNSSTFRRAVRYFPEAVIPLLLAAVLGPAAARGQLVSSGFPVSNPDWQILLTDWGYADLAFDLRPGFVGREYLSGEWAGAAFNLGPMGRFCAKGRLNKRPGGSC